MKMKGFFACIFILVIMATGCLSRQPEVVSTAQSEVIRTSEKVVPRDTIVVAPASTSSLEVLLEQLINQGQFTQKADNAQITLRYLPESRSIEAECYCDSTAIALTLFDRLIENYESRTSDRTTETTRKHWSDNIKWAAVAVLGTASIVGLVKVFKS